MHPVDELRRFLAPSGRRQALGVGVVVSVVGALGRTWVRNGGAPIFWNDSADYVASASLPLVSFERWLGPRPVLMPLALSAAGLDQPRFTLLQTALAAVAWGALAAVVWGSLRSWAGRAVAAVGLAILSLTWPVSMWDEQVLTESLALSTLALTCAAGLWFANAPSPRRGAVLVATSGLWLLARDSHAVPVAVAGLVLLAIAARPRRARGTLVLTGAYLVAISFLIAGSATAGERNLQPLEHVYAVRIFPFPERVAWFEAHGMPQAQAIAAIPEASDPVRNLAPFTPIPPDPTWAPWRRWLEQDGQRTFLRFVAAHPTYLVGETQARPERVFNNGDGLATYEPLERRDLPVVRWCSAVATPVVVAVWLTALFVLLMLRRERRPIVAVAVFLGASALPHALAVWHLDGMESARHLLLPGVQLRISTVLLLAACVDAVAGLRGTGRSRPARSPDRPRAHDPRPA